MGAAKIRDETGVSIRERLQGELQRLTRYALSMTRNREVAGDLVQETCVKALAARRVPQDDAALRVWLFKIVRNLYIDRIRADTRGRGGDAPPARIEPDPWLAQDAQLDRLQVAASFDQLADGHREILTLVDILGFTYRETGAILGVPEGTVMSRVSRARATLLRSFSTGEVIPFRARGRR